jgi:hypothetical protein
MVICESRRARSGAPACLVRKPGISGGFLLPVKPKGRRFNGSDGGARAPAGVSATARHKAGRGRVRRCRRRPPGRFWHSADAARTGEGVLPLGRFGRGCAGRGVHTGGYCPNAPPAGVVACISTPCRVAGTAGLPVFPGAGPLRLSCRVKGRSQAGYGTGAWGAAVCSLWLSTKSFRILMNSPASLAVGGRKFNIRILDR